MLKWWQMICPGPGDDKESVTCQNLLGERVTVARALEPHIRSKRSFWTCVILICEIQRRSEKESVQVYAIWRTTKLTRQLCIHQRSVREAVNMSSNVKLKWTELCAMSLWALSASKHFIQKDSESHLKDFLYMTVIQYIGVGIARGPTIWYYNDT